MAQATVYRGRGPLTSEVGGIGGDMSCSGRIRSKTRYEKRGACAEKKTFLRGEARYKEAMTSALQTATQTMQGLPAKKSGHMPVHRMGRGGGSGDTNTVPCLHTSYQVDVGQFTRGGKVGKRKKRENTPPKKMTHSYPGPRGSSHRGASKNIVEVKGSLKHTCSAGI